MNAVAESECWRAASRLLRMKPYLALRTKCGFLYSSFFLVDRNARALSDIKADPALVRPLADCLCDFLRRTLGPDLAGWCLCTAPRRRHREDLHFASAVCEAASEELGVPFRADALASRTRDRIDPTFSLQADPPEHNIVLFDDIITRGITIRESRRLLLEAGHAVLPVVAIRNG